MVSCDTASTLNCILLRRDYRPYAYLVIHTDTDYLKQYEQFINAEPSYTAVPAEFSEPEEDGTTVYADCPTKLPQHVYDNMIKNAQVHDDLTNAVIWVGNDSSTWNSYSGAMICYDSGLLVIWR